MSYVGRQLSDIPNAADDVVLCSRYCASVLRQATSATAAGDCADTHEVAPHHIEASPRLAHHRQLCFFVDLDFTAVDTAAAATALQSRLPPRGEATQLRRRRREMHEPAKTFTTIDVSVAVHRH